MKVERIFDLLDRYQEKFANKPVAFAAKENGKWVNHSTQDLIKMANLVSIGLLEMGIEKSDKIATVSNNRPEWNFMDHGMMQIGAVHVPIYPTISEEEYRHILRHSEAKFIIVSSQELYDKISPMVAEIDTLQEIYTFDKIPGAKHWTEIVKKGEQGQNAVNRGKLKLRRDAVGKDDLATIIYTSGTTGVPKGVMLSHWNFCFQIEPLVKIIPFLGPKSNALSFLPLCHVLERIGGYVFQYLGVSIYYAESVEKVAENIKEVKPEVFVSVPRLLERIFDKIMEKGNDLEGTKRELFFGAVELGLAYEPSGKDLKYKLKLAGANVLIFKKWREAMGGQLKLIISGGAALQPRLARIFHAAKIPVCEGYGLTETAPVIAVNHTKHPNLRFGTVGPLLDPVQQQVKIAEDGEILFKGPNLMLGYFKDPAKTAEDIDSEGWFHTGDIGLFEEGRFLKITDRKKEMFKLSTGKYVAPQPVENIFKESLFIEQIMVIGAGEKFAGALISPNFEFLHDWAHQNNIHYRDHEELVANPKVIERYQKEVDELNKRLGKTEQLKQFKVIAHSWTVDTGELSPTLKLKRRMVAERYKQQIEEIYAPYR